MCSLGRRPDSLLLALKSLWRCSNFSTKIIIGALATAICVLASAPVYADQKIALLDDIQITVPDVCLVDNTKEKPVLCKSENGDLLIAIFYDAPVATGIDYNQQHLQEVAADAKKKEQSLNAMRQRMLAIAEASKDRDVTVPQAEIRKLGSVWAIIGGYHGSNKNGARIYTAKVQVWLKGHIGEVTAFVSDANTYHLEVFNNILSTMREQLPGENDASSGRDNEDEHSRGGNAVSDGPSSPPTRSSPYVVDGLALGERVNFGSAAYSAYKCVASDQFPGFNWCQRKDQERRGKEIILSSNSILHRSDGTTAYINRSIQPASLTSHEATKEIDRLSAKFGEKARVLNMPERKDLPRGIVASWGKVDLAPLMDTHAISALAAGESPHVGLLMDFLGDLQKSAKLDLPIYRLNGGAGYVWSASFHEKGTGHLRFLAVDVSALSQPQTKVADSDQGNEAPAPEQTEEQASPEQEEASSSGSGFAISNDGLILTNRHVVDGCKAVSVDGSGSAAIKAVDESNDLALLKVQVGTSAASFRSTSVGLGEAVFALGFPYGGMLGAGMNFTSGSISSLSGIRNDTRYLQLTAPVQPGNSGGPLVDAGGLVVGVVSARLNDIEVLKASGSLPQNVNFAIRGDLAQGFLRANGVEPRVEAPRSPSSTSEVAKVGQSYTVHVLCFGLAPVAASTSESDTDTQGTSDTQRIEAFVAHEYLSGDISNRTHLRSVYADQVDYWDKGEIPVAAVIEDKIAYAQRWESLRYQLRPSSIKIAPVGNHEGAYRVEFEFDFIATRNRKVIEGTGRSELELDLSGSEPRITGEHGATLNRSVRYR
jgi:S1-C subfamily serine protease